MKSLIKLLVLLLVLTGFIILTGFVLIQSLEAQIIILILTFLCFALKIDFRKLLAEFKLILPFVILMLVVYALLGLWGVKFDRNLQDENNLLLAALNYGGIRCLLFTCTVLFFQFILSFIEMKDILSLPVSMRSKKVIILGKTLFVLALDSIGNLDLHLRLMPEYQKKRLTLRQYFFLKLQLSLALIMLLLREAKLKGELIDNRILHCFNI
ncbi:MAG TPA: hypothetical protein PLF50_02000 [Candidatus Cloacimonadota bacterium]|nr:hypothetical protein [Candidatus Cloacimonadota bacterium]HOV16260.1 hypothetical protein [Candidatus Cloacimonadota bacterium]HQL14456.1 hypothetical protein [Candidatus Cloacimonadota bacterium]